MKFRLDDEALAAWRTFITAHAVAIERIENDLAQAKRMPLSYYDVLIELEEAPDHRLRLSDLARQVVLSRSGLTRLVDRLERGGLLSREPCETDRRGYYAVLTQAGHEAVRRTWPVYAASIHEHFTRHLTRPQMETLTRALARVLEAAQEESAGTVVESLY